MSDDRKISREDEDEEVETLTRLQIARMIYEHGQQLILAYQGLTVEKALEQASDLAVCAFDDLSVERRLRAAALRHKVPSTLADIMQGRGGASLALSPEDPPA